MKAKTFINRNWAYLFVLVPIVLQLIFFYIPLIQGFFYSLTDWTGLTSNYNMIGFDNYGKIFADQNSLRVSVLL